MEDDGGGYLISSVHHDVKAAVTKVTQHVCLVVHYIWTSVHSLLWVFVVDFIFTSLAEACHTLWHHCLCCWIIRTRCKASVLPAHNQTSTRTAVYPHMPRACPACSPSLKGTDGNTWAYEGAKFPKWDIPCPGRPWTIMQNLTSLALYTAGEIRNRTNTKLQTNKQ